MAAAASMYRRTVTKIDARKRAFSHAHAVSFRTLAPVYDLAGWWYRIATPQESGGVWLEQPKGQFKCLLPWCPEVLATLVARDSNGCPSTHFYTVRVQGQLATLADTRLTEGKGWEQFSAVDLWDCLSLGKVLASIVREQAQALSGIDFREDVQ